MAAAMKLVLAFAALLLLATFAPAGLYKTLSVPTRPLIRFDSVMLSEAEPSRTALGRLHFLGGWTISSNHPGFGGISAMHIEGGAVLAASDGGAIIRFRLPAKGNVAPVDIRPLIEGPGPISPKSNRDLEAMQVSGNWAWIAFENTNAVWRYTFPGWRRAAGSNPPAMAKWGRNRGAEAMLRLPDGRFLVFQEGVDSGDTSEALLFDRDPSSARAKAKRLAYRPPQGYRLTDAALLPGGRILFLNRRIGFPFAFSAKLTLADPRDLDGGTVLEGVEIADLSPPLTVDNMEALSVTREQGRTILWIASDNNFGPLQRTLLLKFALAD